MADKQRRTSEGSIPGTQTLSRATTLLKLISANNRDGMRLVDLFAAAGLERPTTHRLLQGLIAERLVTQDDRTKRYFLGSLMYEMGVAAAAKTDLRDICHPHLLSLADRTGDTVFLTIRSAFHGVCVDRAEGAYPIKVLVLDVGRRRPLNVGCGSLAILSALPDDEVDRICRVNADMVRTRFPRYSESRMREQLALGRALGYVFHDVLEVDNVSSVGVAIRDTDGRPIGALSVSALSSRLEDERRDRVAIYLKESVRSIESVRRRSVEA